VGYRDRLAGTHNGVLGQAVGGVRGVGRQAHRGESLGEVADLARKDGWGGEDASFRDMDMDVEGGAGLYNNRVLSQDTPTTRSAVGSDLKRPNYRTAGRADRRGHRQRGDISGRFDFTSAEGCLRLTTVART